MKSGYNKIASSYPTVRTADSEDVQLLNMLVRRLPEGAMVLDAGCGSGYPVTQFLARYFQVIGVDFSEEQALLAKETVRGVALVRADLSNMPFNSGMFEGLCSYYAIIHIPRSEHSKLLSEFHRILRPNGLALLCMGAGDLPGDIDNWHGAPMYWSHYNNKTNLSMMNEGGFDILWSNIVQDPVGPHAFHLFVLGQKR